MDRDLEKRDEFICTLIKERFSEDWQRIDTLDGKASGVVGFAGIIISLESALAGYLLEKIPSGSNFYHLISSIFLLGIVFLIISIFCAMLAYRIKEWTIAPDPAKLIENYAKKNKSLITIIRVENSD